MISASWNHWVAHVAGWRPIGRLIIAALTGALCVLQFAPFGLWPVGFAAYFALALLLAAAARRPRPHRAAAVIGWAFGFGSFVAGLSWIGAAFFVEADKFAALAPLAVLGLPAFLAVFTAAAATLASLARGDAYRAAALAPALWLGEMARGYLLTGFPWNTAGQALAESSALAQAASLFGAEGLGALALAAFLAPALMAITRRWLAVAPLLALAAIATWGSIRLAGTPSPDRPGVMLRIVQPNIAQTDKWRPELRNAHFSTLIDLSRGNADSLPAGITHLVWPESAIPFLFSANGVVADAAAARRLADLLPDGAQLFVGAERAEASPRGANGEWLIDAVFNTLFVVDGAAGITAAYDKIHLVPFGEYLPGEALLAPLGLRKLTGAPDSFRAGKRAELLPAGLGGAWLPLICYEAIFPAMALSAERPTALVAVTNDAWFGTGSIGPHQHLAQARLRAIETGLPLIRVANTGISTVLDPLGRTRMRLEMGERGSRDVALPLSGNSTPYVNFPWAAWLIAGIIFAAGYAPTHRI